MQFTSSWLIYRRCSVFQDQSFRPRKLGNVFPGYQPKRSKNPFVFCSSMKTNNYVLQYQPEDMTMHIGLKNHHFRRSMPRVDKPVQLCGNVPRSNTFHDI